MTRRVFILGISALLFLSCETTTQFTVECDVTIHVDTLSLSVDSITYEPKAFEDECREEFEGS